MSNAPETPETPEVPNPPFPPANHPTRSPTHTITTPRLIIRTPTAADAAAVAAILTDPANNPFTTPSASGSAAELTATYAARIARWAAAAPGGERAFLLFTLRDGTPVGFGGFNEFRWGPPLGGGGEGEGAVRVLEVDLGAQVDATHWRRGYAREALAGKMEYAFGVLGADHCSMDTDGRNEPWRGLMRAMGLGGVEGRRVRGKGEHGGEEGEEEFFYRVGKGTWEEAKRGMVEAGTWPL